MSDQQSCDASIFNNSNQRSRDIFDVSRSTVQRGAFWGYLLSALVALLLAGIVGGINNSALERNRPPFALPRNVAALVWIVALALLAMGIYYGTFSVDMATAGIINILFFLQLIFFVAWSLVYQRFGDLNNSFWAGVILFILGLATLYFLWQAGARQASILVLLYLVWLGYEVFISWQALRRSGQNVV